MKRVVIIEENQHLPAGNSTDCLVIKAGGAHNNRAIEAGGTVSFTFNLGLKAPENFGAIAMFRSKDVTEGAVAVVFLAPELVKNGAELAGSYVAGNEVYARIRFTQGILLSANTELLHVRFFTDTIQFKSVGAPKQPKPTPKPTKGRKVKTS